MNKQRQAPDPYEGPYPGESRDEHVHRTSDYRGTSRGDMPNVLRTSDASKIVECPECGYTGGRHSRTCSTREEAT